MDIYENTCVNNNQILDHQFILALPIWFPYTIYTIQDVVAAG
jgi:hypothetical protein